jgi:hypothetical protein
MSKLKARHIVDVYDSYYTKNPFGERSQVYLKKDVDAAIAELKDVIHELQVNLEGAKATAYAESVDAGMRERRLKRALYKACANWAHFAVVFFSSYAIKERWYKMERKCLKKAEEYK